MKTLLIGDVHGLVDRYKTLLDQHKPERSIQLGDFGFRMHHEWHRVNVSPFTNHVLFGNHDDMSCIHMAHSMGHYNCLPAMGLFYARGAYSIDHSKRTLGVDWWDNEELTYTQLMYAIQEYEKNKPRVVLTHDCPQLVREELFGIREHSRTTMAFEFMFEYHQPEYWIFGHHHRSMTKEIAGTTFRCLAELETMWLDI